VPDTWPPPFAVVAEIMGWSAATAVRMAKRYGHIGESARRQAMAALETPGAETPAGAARSSALIEQPVTVQ
jgi:hypothetical protein